MQAGLSFEQAPPLALPLRFFLTAPLFLLAAGALIAMAPQALASRWTPEALALTHAITLGVLAMTMLGALTQMLPVVAGATLPAARVVARLAHIALTLGTAALLAAFLGAGPAVFGVALVLLGTAFAIFLAAAARSLARAVTNATVNGMRLAAASLAATIVLAGALALPRAGWVPGTPGMATVGAHATFGLLGWVLLLVVGVAYQVVPMFQLTPPYAPRLSRWLAPGLFVMLVVRAAAPVLPAAVADAAAVALAGGILLFAGATLRLQARRRRKIADVTLDYWRLGMTSLVACVGVWLAAWLAPAWRHSDAYPLLLGVLFLGGFALSVVSGMLYKIVPFLAWFHLQAQTQARAGSIPTMKDMIGERWARWQFRAHLAACALLAGGLAWPALLRMGGVLLMLSALLLALNLASAVRRFARHGGRFR
ncbi:hypothetical protein [Thiobacillus sedimenti]|uniref:Permease n=1 Tax=Thiobacillus sedimenti TaxID=3110231 RepID=A0ABZ1CI56_9PROT|nr:hypothetical protein [Thiobacillus sp. SCUT-2]WRS38693.1 hypothetical protein VA613_11865 [Thiobacillus sp. SCUT-2]